MGLFDKNFMKGLREDYNNQVHGKRKIEEEKKEEKPNLAVNTTGGLEKTPDENTPEKLN